MKKILRYAGAAALALAVQIAQAYGAETQAKTPSDHQDTHEVRIPEKTAREAGIETAVAGPGDVRRSVTLYGKTAADHSAIAHLRARYPGPVVSVQVKLGDQVQKGQQLAVIESNDSLQRYSLLAPISGQIIDKAASAGEYSGDRELFTIANYDELWVELQVFAGHRPEITRGQRVRISAGNLQVDSSIASLAPAASGQPYAIARVALDNRDNQWTTDMMVQGDVVVGAFAAPVVVDNRALQPLRGATVVFVKNGDRYRAQSVELGRRGRTVTEIVSGLNAGERYVTANSYLIKADIEKSGAGHHH
ncbi:efflux RND transporter periplasmic adaptor subunit [uncultured Microbulbifer sp.]|uniref:efflux RND transporter periplasmic adaptor subunit n=1 Tax=uncultured Microbulbifer sp. TaxID=348147 RepID=UPI0025DFE6F2|nr:efflux RND transporter periplasmic adaptor subunit [uncultured Microbulbifer sp.]